MSTSGVDASYNEAQQMYGTGNYEGALLKFYGSVAADCDGASAPFKDCFTNKLRKAFAARRATCRPP